MRNLCAKRRVFGFSIHSNSYQSNNKPPTKQPVIWFKIKAKFNNSAKMKNLKYFEPTALFFLIKVFEILLYEKVITQFLPFIIFVAK